MAFGGFSIGGTELPALADDFNRANSSSPGGALPNEPLFSGESGAQIVSNALQLEIGASTAGGVYGSGDEASADLAVVYRISTVPTTDGGIIWMYLRMPGGELPLNGAGANESYFRVGAKRITGAADQVQCDMVIAGTATTLSVDSGALTAPGAPEWANGDYFGFTIREQGGGTKITAWYRPSAGSWSFVCSWFTTNASRKTTAGRTGIELFDNGGTPAINDLYLEAYVPGFAVEFDKATESVRTATTDPWTFSHTPQDTPRGVVLVAIHGASSTDHISSVTYGGVAMSRVVTVADAAGEPGRSDIWFLGTGIPTGTQTVSVDLASATGDDFQFVLITLTTDDGSDIEMIDSDSTSGDIANPSLTLQYASRYALAIAGLYGGGAAPSSFVPNANCVEVASEDLGNFYAFTFRQAAGGTADFAIGGTSAADDVALVAAAFAKVVSGVTETPTPGGGTASGVSPVAVVTSAQGGATGGSNGASAVSGVTPGGATAGGPDATASATASPTPGGAVASGRSPSPYVSITASGATGGGNAAAAVAAVTAGGAIAGGNAPTDGTTTTETPTPGGGTASGNSPTAVVAGGVGGATGGGTGATSAAGVQPGGAVAAGNSPTAASTATPVPGGATAAGSSPSVMVTVAQGGATGAGNTAAAVVLVGSGGAVAGGNQPTEAFPGAAVITGHFDLPTPGGLVGVNPRSGAFDRPSPGRSA